MGLFDLFNSTPKEVKAKAEEFKDWLRYDDMDRTYPEFLKIQQDKDVIDHLKETLQKPTEKEKKWSRQEQTEQGNKRVQNWNRLTILHDAAIDLEKGNGDKVAALYSDDRRLYQTIMRHPKSSLDTDILGKTRMKALAPLAERIDPKYSGKINQEIKTDCESSIYTEGAKAAKEFAQAGNIRDCRKALELVQITNKYNTPLTELVMGYHKDALKNDAATVPFMVAKSTLPVKERDSDVTSRGYEISELPEYEREEIMSKMKSVINYNDSEMARMLISYSKIDNSYQSRNSVIGTGSQQRALEMLVDPDGFNILDKNATHRFAQENRKNVVREFHDTAIARMDYEYEARMRSVILPDMAGVDKFIASYNTDNAQKETPAAPLNYSTLAVSSSGGSFCLPGHVAELLYNERLKDKYDPKQELSLEMSNDLTAFNNAAYAVLNGSSGTSTKLPLIELVKNVIRMEKVEDVNDGKPLEVIQDNFNEDPKFAGQSFDMLMALKKNKHRYNEESVQSIEDGLKAEYRQEMLSKNKIKITPGF